MKKQYQQEYLSLQYNQNYRVHCLVIFGLSVSGFCPINADERVNSIMNTEYFDIISKDRKKTGPSMLRA